MIITLNILMTTNSIWTVQIVKYTGCSKKMDPLVYFDDNFDKYKPILTSHRVLAVCVWVG